MLRSFLLGSFTEEESIKKLCRIQFMINLEVNQVSVLVRNIV